MQCIPKCSETESVKLQLPSFKGKGQAYVYNIMIQYNMSECNLTRAFRVYMCEKDYSDERDICAHSGDIVVVASLLRVYVKSFTLYSKCVIVLCFAFTLIYFL